MSADEHDAVRRPGAAARAEDAGDTAGGGRADRRGAGSSPRRSGGRSDQLIATFLLGLVAGTGAVGSAVFAPDFGPVSSSARAGEPAPAEPPAAADLAPSLHLPDEVNERVDRWIRHYLERDRHGFREFLSRETIYGEMIREKLRERGMPEELIYLAMIESGFSTAAVSPVHASGLWQFMGPTAREYGLEIGDYVDERRDPLRATDAALDYLERLKERFGSWYLAAAAYNAGPNRVARVLRRHGDRIEGDEDVFWMIADQLPSETREYVPKLLAAILLTKEAERYGFDDVTRSEPYRFERVWVPGGTPLQQIAGALDAPASELRALNPHLIRGSTPPGSPYPVRIPPGGTSRVVAALGGGEWRLAD